jgi:general secretion pathway protein I
MSSFVKRWDGGFTLLEVMVALAILGLVFISLVALRNRDVQAQEEAIEVTTATMLAQRKLSEMELSGLPEFGEASGDFGDDPPGYRWLRQVVPTLFEFAREVRVVVLWGEGPRTQQVEIFTYVSDEE